MIDESLIAQVQFKATGATIHNVNTWLAIYRLNAEALERFGQNNVQIQLFKKAEQKLKAFVFTGEI